MATLINSKRLVSFLLTLFISFTALMAQTSEIKHIVDRGETLESIATKYNITTQEIIKLNPQAAQFIYTGMELKIPAAKSKPATGQSDMSAQSQQTVPQSSDNRNRSANDYSYNSTDPDDGLGSFSSYGVWYRSSFKAIDKGHYGFGGRAFTSDSDQGWGFDLDLGFNFGIVDPANCLFLVGPAYGGVLNENTALSCGLDFLGVYSTSTEKDENNKSKDKNRFDWGFAATPTVTFKISKARLNLGIQAEWAKGSDEIQFGFMIGIGGNF